MSGKKPVYDVVATVVIGGSYHRVPVNPTSRCMAIMQQIETGAYDWMSIARSTFNDLANGGELIVTMTWINGYSVWAAFDCTLPDAPIIRCFYLVKDESIPIVPTSSDGETHTSTYLTMKCDVDYTYRSVINALTARVTDVVYEIDNPITGFNQDDGPTDRPVHGGFPGDARLLGVKPEDN
jgi:hypothetical protein